MSHGWRLRPRTDAKGVTPDDPLINDPSKSFDLSDEGGILSRRTLREASPVLIFAVGLIPAVAAVLALLFIASLMFALALARASAHADGQDRRQTSPETPPDTRRRRRFVPAPEAPPVEQPESIAP